MAGSHEYRFVKTAIVIFGLVSVPGVLAQTVSKVSAPDQVGRATADFERQAADEAFSWNFVSKYQLVQVRADGGSSKMFHLGNVDLIFDWDLEKPFGWSGLKLRASLLGNVGGEPSEAVGDAQVSSNIEADGDFLKVYETFIEKSFDDGEFLTKFGLIDLNVDFYANEAAGLFMNSSFGIGSELAATGENGPSIFPTTATAVVAKSINKSGFYVSGGAFNAIAGDLQRPLKSHFHHNAGDGFLGITEAGIEAEQTSDTAFKISKMSVGSWHYSRATQEIEDAAVKDVNYGSYGLIEVALPEQLRVFARHGFANPRVNSIASNSALGLTRRGILGINRDDVLGLGITKVSFGRQWVDSQSVTEALTGCKCEIAYEVTWRIPLMESVAIQPDIQYAVQPSGVKRLGSPVTIGSVRIDVEL